MMDMIVGSFSVCGFRFERIGSIVCASCVVLNWLRAFMHDVAVLLMFDAERRYKKVCMMTCVMMPSLHLSL